MGNNTAGGDSGDDEIIPLAALMPSTNTPKNSRVIPVVIAAFVAALAGAVIGSQIS